MPNKSKSKKQNKPAQACPQPAKQGKGKKRRNKKGSSGTPEGVMHFSRHELVTTLSTGSDGKVHVSLALHPSAFPFLKGLGNLFERIQWKQIKVYYKPAVGTTVGGLVSYGISWDSTAKDDRSKIASLTPNTSCAVWADQASKPMTLPSNRLQSRNWYVLDAGEAGDKQPGTLEVAVESEKKSSTVGEIWIQYAVTLMGTTS